MNILYRALIKLFVDCFFYVALYHRARVLNYGERCVWNEYLNHYMGVKILLKCFLHNTFYFYYTSHHTFIYIQLVVNAPFLCTQAMICVDFLRKIIFKLPATHHHHKVDLMTLFVFESLIKWLSAHRFRHLIFISWKHRNFIDFLMD